MSLRKNAAALNVITFTFSFHKLPLPFFSDSDLRFRVEFDDQSSSKNTESQRGSILTLVELI